MAAPVAASIILPSDTGNSGKHNRTQTRSVGGSSVHEHFQIPLIAYEVVSKFVFSGAQQTVLATAQNATTTGFYWFELPATATVSAVIRRIVCDVNASSALATPTAPRIVFSKFTFTGTASGASVSAVPWTTAATAAQMVIRTAVTGMVVSLVGGIGQCPIPAAETGVGVYNFYKDVLPHNPLAFTRGQSIEIGPGEGIVVWQDVNGTAADTRKVAIEVEWDEVDLS